MSITYSHAQLVDVDEELNENILYPQTTTLDVIIKSNNTKLPNDIESLNDLVDNLDSTAFTNGIEGAISSMVSTNGETNKVLITDSSGKLANSTVSNEEIQLLNGATTNITDIEKFISKAQFTLSVSEWTENTEGVYAGYVSQVKTVNKVYDVNADVGLIPVNSIPTTAELEAYSCIAYVIANDTNNTITFLGSQIPETDITVFVNSVG